MQPLQYLLLQELRAPAAPLKEGILRFEEIQRLVQLLFLDHIQLQIFDVGAVGCFVDCLAEVLQICQDIVLRKVRELFDFHAHS